MLKVDVEGAGVRLLRGAEKSLRRFRPSLLLEVSAQSLRRQGASREELFDLLQGLGYGIFDFEAERGLPSARLQCLPDSANLIAMLPGIATEAA